MTGLTFSATCADCGGPLTLAQSTRPTASESTALLGCEGCGRRWQVIVRMLSVVDCRAAERKRGQRRLVGAA